MSFVPGTMAEANIAGTFYVCTIATGPDRAQMYTVRFANGAQQQVHASLLRMNQSAAAPVVVVSQPAQVVVVSQPAPATVSTTTTTAPVTGFVVGEEIQALFRNSWFTAKIIKSFGNGKYKVKYLKSKTFSTVTENKMRKKNVVRKIVTTTTVSPGAVVAGAVVAGAVVGGAVAGAQVGHSAVSGTTSGISADLKRADRAASNTVSSVEKDFSSGLKSAGCEIDKFFFGKPKKKKTVTKKTTSTVTTVTPAAPVAPVRAPAAAAVVVVPPVTSDVPVAAYPQNDVPVAAASYPTPAATASYPTPAANTGTGIYPTIAPAAVVTVPAPAPAPVIVAAPAPVIVTAPAAPKQKFQVTTVKSTKIVKGKKVVTTTTKRTAVPAAAPTQRFNVIVPAGCVAGQMITISAPNGQQASVIIPAGVYPGQSFQVTM